MTEQEQLIREYIDRTPGNTNPTILMQMGNKELTNEERDAFEKWVFKNGTSLNSSVAVQKIYTEQTPLPPAISKYLYATATSDGVKAQIRGSLRAPIQTGIYYSLDEGKTWNEYILGEDGTNITLNNNQRIYFKANKPSGPYAEKFMHPKFSGGTCIVGGNPMSLIDGGTETVTELPADGCFQRLFSGSDSITSAEELLLPALTLRKDCYAYMFAGCSNLIKGPSLPATTLASGCYRMMYSGTQTIPDCSHIDFTNAEVIQTECCYGLFSGTPITDEDLYRILPINPLTNHYYLPIAPTGRFAYRTMFCNCALLTEPPEMVSCDSNVCTNMFENCQSLIKVPNISSGFYGNNMFYDCTSLIISDTQTEEAPYAWTIPSTGTFSDSRTLKRIFFNCAGTRASDDLVCVAGETKTYYTQNPPIG